MRCGLEKRMKSEINFKTWCFSLYSVSSPFHPALIGFDCFKAVAPLIGLELTQVVLSTLRWEKGKVVILFISQNGKYAIIVPKRVKRSAKGAPWTGGCARDVTVEGRRATYCEEDELDPSVKTTGPLTGTLMM